MSDLYDASVPVFDTMLKNLSALLAKGAAHAAARGFDPAVLLNARLAPDMFPLVKQVQIATDAAKFGAARVTGLQAPPTPDDETTFEQLIARIESVRAFLATIPREAFAGADDRRVEIKLRTRSPVFEGRTYVLHWVLPNFYFHVVTAYALLRHNGVDLGKNDYLGPVPTLA